MDKFTLESLSGRRINVTELTNRVGISRQTFYDSCRRGFFRPDTAKAIAEELGIRDPRKLAYLAGVADTPFPRTRQGAL